MTLGKFRSHCRKCGAWDPPIKYVCFGLHPGHFCCYCNGDVGYDVYSEPEKERTTPFIYTYTGIKFYPLEPKLEEISIIDIVHALSNICRFTGHVKYSYSVAQHSVHVSQLCKKYTMWGLLHDASEAYLTDFPAPLKNSPELGKAYKEYESKLMAMVCQRFGIQPDMPDEVDIADKIMVTAEMRDLMGNPPWGIQGIVPRPERVIPVGPEVARELFYDRFVQIGGKIE